MKYLDSFLSIFSSKYTQLWWISAAAFIVFFVVLLVIARNWHGGGTATITFRCRQAVGGVAFVHFFVTFAIFFYWLRTFNLGALSNVGVLFLIMLAIDLALLATQFIGINQFKTHD